MCILHVAWWCCTHEGVDNIVLIVAEVRFQELLFIKMDQSVEQIFLYTLLERVGVNLRQLSKHNASVSANLGVGIIWEILIRKLTMEETLYDFIRRLNKAITYPWECNLNK